MGLKDNLIAREEGREEAPVQEELTKDADFELDLSLLGIHEDEKKETNEADANKELSSDNLLIEEDALTLDEPEDLKIDTKSEAVENKEEDEADVCPKCGGKRRRNGNYYHLKTCEDYKVNGIYPNRKNNEANESGNDTELDIPEELDATEEFLEVSEDTPEAFPADNTAGEATELHEQLMKLAKQVILEDVKTNYTSKLLTSDALNNLIDSYLSGEDANSIANANQVFSSVLDEIISANYKENHYANLTVPVLEAIKEEL